MDFVFFDIECANCYDGKGKPCTFGYVITDENFRVKESDDILINPRAPWDFYVRKKIIKYDLKEFDKAPEFDGVYPAVKRIMTARDRMVFGYSVQNDIKFLYDACERYGCRQPVYDYIDVSLVYKTVKRLKDEASLSAAVAEYGSVFEGEKHKSVDDAFNTMTVFKNLCAELNLTSTEAVSEFFSGCGGNSLFKIKLFGVKNLNEIESVKDFCNLKNKFKKPAEAYVSEGREKTVFRCRLTGKRVAVNHSFFSDDFIAALKLLKRMKQSGIATVRRGLPFDFILTGKKEEREGGKKELDATDMLQILGMSSDELAQTSLPDFKIK